MEWKSIYETGIKKVDSEHQMLVELINKLEKAMSNGDSNKVIGNVLKDLVDYVKIHFKSEEEVMKKIGFPDLKRHQNLHKDLVNDVARILIDFKNGKTWTAEELSGFLHMWLLDHILEEDRKIGVFLGVI